MYIAETNNTTGDHKNMRFPTFYEELELLAQGYRNIVGIDEVGRGAWAGPVVAGCVIFPPELIDKATPKWLADIRDSKTLSSKKRAELGQFIVNYAAWGIGECSHQEIDRWGIGQATKEAMRRALAKLDPTPDWLLIDGRERLNSETPQETIIDGDSLVRSIAAASIIAKVYRDQLMAKYNDQYPNYGFASHVGYGTWKHQESLKLHGPSPIHRLSYRPIKMLACKNNADTPVSA